MAYGHHLAAAGMYAVVSEVEVTSCIFAEKHPAVRLDSNPGLEKT